MGDENPIRTLRDYSKPSQEGYRNTIELPVGNNVGIAEDVLVDVAEHVYPMDFVILDIKEDEKRPFILGTPFLTTAKAVIKFDKGIITLRSGKSKISFHRIPESSCKIEKGVKNDIEPISLS
ncbi:reverse transcriptase domain-containing protein [Tanacetum coccineum]